METFSLKWNDFQPNVSKSFKRLRHEEDYSDVTLIGDDYQPLRAHKVVLSSCSEYFKNILFNSRKFPNPVLCMEGLTKGDLTNVLDFVYNGEIQILQDGLDRFMTIAKRLKLEGLNGQESENQVDQTEETTEEGVLKEALNSQKNEKEMFFFQSQKISGQEVNQQLDELYSLGLDSLNSVIFQCNFCSKNSKKKGHMREHVEKHVEGLQFQCNLCDKSYKTRNTLRSHTSKIHHAKKSHNDREEGFSDQE